MQMHFIFYIYVLNAHYFLAFSFYPYVMEKDQQNCRIKLHCCVYCTVTVRFPYFH